MATKAEQFRGSAQRTGRPKRTSMKKTKKGARSRDKAHAGSKATHALETVAAGRPSRESTRGSANRVKPDAAFNLTEERRNDEQQARARRARARNKRVRGSSK